MKKGIISLSVISAILICAFIGNNILFDNTKNNSNKDTEIENEKVESEKSTLRFESFIDLASDYSDSRILTDSFKYIALIRIDSIDGVDNYDTVINQYVSPYTYGKATVLKVLKGEVNQEQIGFRRLGGKMPFDEWIKGDEAPEKIMKIREESGLKNVPTKDIIVDSGVSGDIDIEEGKTYLAFLEYDKSLNKENEYWIGGLQYGLRETQQSDVSAYTTQNTTDLKVKNNITGEWENISDVVDFNVNK